MGKLSSTWSLMGASWDVLKKDKEMLVFPFCSMICCLIVLASFAVPIVASGSWQPPGQDAPAGRQIAYYGALLLFYFCNYFVIVFFNAALIACAVMRMEGGDPTVGQGFRAASARLPLIFGWALVSATVGLVLRIIEDRSEKVGRFVAGLLGMAWAVVSFLVVPVMVVERKGPFAALKQSTAMLKETWGQQVVGNFSFGLVFFLLGIPAYVLIVAGFLSGVIAAAIACIALAVVYLVILALVQSALQGIFQAAVYLYACTGKAPEDFGEDLLSSAMVQR